MIPSTTPLDTRHTLCYTRSMSNRGLVPIRPTDVRIGDYIRVDYSNLYYFTEGRVVDAQGGYLFAAGDLLIHDPHVAATVYLTTPPLPPGPRALPTTLGLYIPASQVDSPENSAVLRLTETGWYIEDDYEDGDAEHRALYYMENLGGLVRLIPETHDSTDDLTETAAKVVWEMEDVVTRWASVLPVSVIPTILEGMWAALPYKSGDDFRHLLDAVREVDFEKASKYGTTFGIKFREV